jgi:6-phosphofructo-2-kinase/fructose-2,6-biphosphatase 4
LEENIRKVKLGTPDYRDMDPDQAMEDFRERRRNYESVYKTLDASDGSYIKIYNCKKFKINNIRGYLPLKVRQ